jgi:hypothetical protein
LLVYSYHELCCSASFCHVFLSNVWLMHEGTGKRRLDVARTATGDVE